MPSRGRAASAEGAAGSGLISWRNGVGNPSLGEGPPPGSPMRVSRVFVPSTGNRPSQAAGACVKALGQGLGPFGSGERLVERVARGRSCGDSRARPRTGAFISGGGLLAPRSHESQPRSPCRSSWYGQGRTDRGRASGTIGDSRPILSWVLGGGVGRLGCAGAGAGVGAGPVERVWLRPGTWRHLQVPGGLRERGQPSSWSWERARAPRAWAAPAGHRVWWHQEGAGITPGLDAAGARGGDGPGAPCHVAANEPSGRSVPPTRCTWPPPSGCHPSHAPCLPRASETWLQRSGVGRLPRGVSTGVRSVGTGKFPDSLLLPVPPSTSWEP